MVTKAGKGAGTPKVRRSAGTAGQAVRPAGHFVAEPAAVAYAVPSSASNVVALRNGQQTARRYRHDLRSADLRRRVEIERDGVPHDVVKALIEDLGASASEFQKIVGMPKATYIKKIAHKELFSGVSGQSVVGIMDLINLVEDMLGDALDAAHPDAANFDVEAWVGRWIRTPQPALGGAPPAELLDTPSGRQSVMRVLGALQSGAYL